MDFLKYITEQALILIPVLYVIGRIIKASAINDKYIPVMLLVISVILSVLLLGVSVDSALQGILIAGITVFTDQTIKQLSEK